MSDARISSALVMMRLTIRMTGASDARSFSCWTSASKAISSPRCSTSPMIWPSAVLPVPYRRSSAASSSVGIATIGLISRPVTIRNAPIVYSSVGSAIASASSCSSSRTGSARHSRRNRCEMRSSRIGNSGIRRDVDQRQPELRGQRLGDVALRAGAQRHQQRAQLLAGILLQAQRALQPRGVELAALDQDFAEAFAGGGVQGRRGRRRRVGQNEINHNTPTPGNPLSSPANQSVANDFCNKPLLRRKTAPSDIAPPGPKAHSF